MSYWHRRNARLEKAQLRRDSNHFIKVLEVNAIQRRYEMAWLGLHGTKIQVAYRKGWYWILGRAYRQSAITDMTLALEAAKHERDLMIPEEV